MRKKVDDRVRTLIENGVKTHHRSLLVLVGDHGEAPSPRREAYRLPSRLMAYTPCDG